MKKIIAIGLLICMSINIFAQTYHTRINFIHGMNGSGQSLYRVRYDMTTWDKTERLYSMSIDNPITYDSPNGIIKSAQTVGAELNKPEYWSAQKRIIIAHSLGGLVARQWNEHRKMNKLKQAYDGIITLNTPHLGTKIAEVLSDRESAKKFNNFVKDAVGKIINGPKNDAYSIAKTKFAGAASNLIPSTGLVDEALNIAFNTMINRFIVALTNDLNATDYIQKSVAGSNQILSDLASNSTVIEQLNSNNNYSETEYDVNQFKISIHGDAESDKEIFRMIASSFYIDKIPSSKVGLLTSEETEKMDMGLIHAIADITAFYDERINHYEAEAKKFLNRGIAGTLLAPIVGPQTYLYNVNYTIAKRKIQQYQDSKSYLNSSFEFTLKTYLGLHFRENDGLVTKDSQIGIHGALPIFIKGINHESVKVHYKTGVALKQIFYGNHDVFLKHSLRFHKDFFKLYSE